MGNVIGGLMGTNRLSGTGDEMRRTASRYAEQAQFQPYTVRTGSGTSGYADGQFTSQLSQPYQDILRSSLGGAGSLFQQAAAFDPTQRASQIFGEQSALLQPAFEQQATQLQNRLFGSGRLGLRLAGESQGLGAGSGMVSPDALGLGRAQQQTLAQLAADSRNQAFSEQSQLQQMASGMLTSGIGISELENALLQQGVDANTARAAAAASAGTLGTSYFNPVMDAAKRRQEVQGDTVGSLIGYGASLFSDIRLKENIEKVGELANGLGIYNWDWKADINQPTTGVIAQEVLAVIPDAVSTHESGYLMVDYSHPELEGVH